MILQDVNNIKASSYLLSSVSTGTNYGKRCRFLIIYCIEDLFYPQQSLLSLFAEGMDIKFNAP